MSDVIKEKRRSVEPIKPKLIKSLEREGLDIVKVELQNGRMLQYQLINLSYAFLKSEQSQADAENHKIRLAFHLPTALIEVQQKKKLKWTDICDYYEFTRKDFDRIMSYAFEWALRESKLTPERLKALGMESEMHIVKALALKEMQQTGASLGQSEANFENLVREGQDALKEEIPVDFETSVPRIADLFVESFEIACATAGLSEKTRIELMKALIHLEHPEVSQSVH